VSDALAAWRNRDRAEDLIAQIDAALGRGEIDESGWHERVADIIRPAYLAGATPQAQSGFSAAGAGAPGRVATVAWWHARGILAAAIDREGTFLDVGCANGLLMETLTAWSAAKGTAIEPYGLDIVNELAELARQRLPHWADRIFVGNALSWIPPRRFDFVRTGVDYVPPRRRRDLIERLLRDVVAPRGRLIIGVYTDGDPRRSSLREAIEDSGFVVAGSVERAHRIRTNELQRVLWIDANGTYSQ
jgi:SAM-dependent methyltransferase